MRRFTLDLLNKKSEQDEKDALKNIKSMHPNATIKIIKSTKTKSTFEVTDVR